MVRIYATALALIFGAALAGAAAPARAAEEKVLYAFQAGETPGGTLLDVDGTLYGTTQSGGTERNGSVFALDLATGAEKVVYSFHAGSDGSDPGGSLISVGGLLYGTTSKGGLGAGTVFSLDLENGAEAVVYSFQGGGDGPPNAGLVDVGGILFGTSSAGGANETGMVFSLDPTTGTEKVLHAFTGEDGSGPDGLVNVGSTLYGTTFTGGVGGGSVFSVDPSTGVFTTVYAFRVLKGCHEFCPHWGDGNGPESGVISVGGILYGTTLNGGRSPNCVFGGCGTIFSLDPSTGMEKIAHSFRGLSHVANPASGLVRVRGRLYGTAPSGVFWYNPTTGAEKIAYLFQGGDDGAQPAGSLINVDGTLYGITSYGGGSPDCGVSDSGVPYGCGTIFAIRP